MPPRNRIKTFCDTCKKDIEKIPCQIKEKNYCSISCSSKAPRKPRNSVEIKCLSCGKDFRKFRCHLREGVNNFCSLTCKGKGQSAQSTKEIKCGYCGKNVIKQLSRIQEKDKNFCSKSCKTRQDHKEGKLNITTESRLKQSKSLKQKYQDDPEFRQRNSEMVKQLWKDGIFKGVHLKHSRMERELKPFLAKLGFESTIDTTFKILCNDRTRIPDFYNETTKEIIEVFGVWWHRDQPGVNHESEEYVIERYAEVGWKCKVVWEDQYKEYLFSLEEII